MVLANTRTALTGLMISFALVLAACDSNEPKEKKNRAGSGQCQW